MTKFVVEHQCKYKSNQDLKLMPDKKAVLQDMKVIFDIFSKYNIACCLHGGTLLGAIRESNFLYADSDVDLLYIGTAEKLMKTKDDVEKAGFYFDAEYCHSRIIAPNERSKLCISILCDKGDHYIEDSYVTNIFGKLVDFLVWELSIIPPEYKYNSRFSRSTLKKFNMIFSFIPQPARNFLIFILRELYWRIGYQDREFSYKKDIITPFKKFNFLNLEVLIPNQPITLIELFYGKDWKIPQDEYDGRNVRVIPNRNKFQ